MHDLSQQLQKGMGGIFELREIRFRDDTYINVLSILDQTFAAVFLSRETFSFQDFDLKSLVNLFYCKSAVPIDFSAF